MFVRLVVFYVIGVLAVNAMNIRIHPIVSGLIGGLAIFVAVVMIYGRGKVKSKATKRKRRKAVKR